MYSKFKLIILLLLKKFDWYIESSSISSSNVNNSPNQIETNSINSLSRSRIQFDQRSLVNIKPSLTGSYAIDEELHSVLNDLNETFL